MFLKVRHRWCELIVKHKYTKAYKHVEKFLEEDQVGCIFTHFAADGDSINVVLAPDLGVLNVGAQIRDI